MAPGEVFTRLGCKRLFDIKMHSELKTLVLTRMIGANLFKKGAILENLWHLVKKWIIKE
jgi:hypothetical protein